MSGGYDEVTALVVRWDNQETPWVAACMNRGTEELLNQEEWDAWKRKALEMVLHEPHEVREVRLRIPRQPLIDLFAVQEIDVEVTP